MTYADLDYLIDYLHGKGEDYALQEEIIKENPTLKVESLLKRLRKDGFVDCEVELYPNRRPDGTAEQNKYKLSFDGFLFRQSGKYAQKNKRDSNRAALQFWQTWAIVVGTFLAGVYGIFELIKTFCR